MAISTLTQLLNYGTFVSLLLSWCLMSSDVIWHIRDKLRPMPKHGSIHKVYACLAVTCHLHFWQNDRDFLRATVVTQGWNGYRNKSQHRKLTLEKKISPAVPATFVSLLLSWCLMSSDVIWHIRDKLWPMPKHGSIRKVYACLAVTCHPHFWQNDRDFLRATVVTRGWNGYRNKSQHRKSTLEKKILPPFQQGFEPATFQSRVRRSNHWAIPAPPLCRCCWVDA